MKFAGRAENFLLEVLELRLKISDHLVLFGIAGIAFFERFLQGQDQAVLLADSLIQL